nr:hypothetical protein CFP56_65815 [Quercus suber]
MYLIKLINLFENKFDCNVSKGSISKNVLIVGILDLCCLNMDLGSAMTVNTVNAKVIVVKVRWTGIKQAYCEFCQKQSIPAYAKELQRN